MLLSFFIYFLCYKSTLYIFFNKCIFNVSLMYNNIFSYKNIADKLNSIFKDFNNVIKKDVKLDKKN